jgi:hypothetical protein
MPKHFEPSLDFLEIDLIEFLQRLYVRISQSTQPPSPENLSQLLQDAFEDSSPVFVEEDNELIEDGTAKTLLLLFLHAEIRYLDGYPHETIEVERFFRNLTHLAREEGQLDGWESFKKTLRRSLEMNLLARVLQPNGDSALSHLSANQDYEIEPDDLALFAWAAAIYLLIDTNRYDPDDTIFSYKQCPPNGEYYPSPSWRDLYASRDQRLKILEGLRHLLLRSLSVEECDALIEAARFFQIAYPEAEGIGNADADVFAEDVSFRWRSFAPKRELFDRALGRTEAFDSEWAMVAQVLWQHHRWSGSFYEGAAAYFVERSLTLHLSTPAHYLNFVGVYQPSPKEKVSLKHPTAINHFYWAEYLFYFKKDLDAALESYLFFVKKEPAFLPNNTFSLRGQFDCHRCYPASTQEALTKIAKILLQQKKLPEAGNYLDAAIALRPQNFQAPYELLAELYTLQGRHKEASALLDKKGALMKATKSLTQRDKKNEQCFYIEFDPTKERRELFGGEYYRTRLVRQSDLQSWINAIRKLM